MKNDLNYNENSYNRTIDIDTQNITQNNLLMKYPDRPLPWKKPDNFGSINNPIDLSEEV